MNTEHKPGLYIVATPIGNLGDISPRAVATLARADIVACEDSRVTGKLLKHLGLKRPLQAYHDHNADQVRPGLLARMGGQVIVLTSDAGTPLISDPGYKLVRDARAAGHLVTTIPGPCAAISALTLAGLPTDKFLFIGFLPAKEKARQEAIQEVSGVRASIIFFESASRVAATLGALRAVLGNREAAVVREISKLFEETRTGTLSELEAGCRNAPPKGEIVVVVAPPGPASAATQAEVDAALCAALDRLPVAKAASEVARATGADRKALYTRALELKAR